MQEFMIATEIKENGSLEDKLRWAFRIYDKDMSGRHRDNLILFSMWCRLYHYGRDGRGTGHSLWDGGFQ